MLVFGPYRAIPKDSDFTVYNLSSVTQAIPRLPGLLVTMPANLNPEDEKAFDMWYYDYVFSDITAYSSLMTILSALYDNTNVYICINEYESGEVINILNESFMKLIQSRYDIKYSIINEADDLKYIPIDGCDFGSVAGIKAFDEDRKAFIHLCEEQRILNGGTIDVEV